MLCASHRAEALRERAVLTAKRTAAPTLASSKMARTQAQRDEAARPCSLPSDRHQVGHNAPAHSEPEATSPGRFGARPSLNDEAVLEQTLRALSHDLARSLQTPKTHVAIEKLVARLESVLELSALERELGARLAALEQSFDKLRPRYQRRREA
jgi:hypothetical protein